MIIIHDLEKEETKVFGSVYFSTDDLIIMDNLHNDLIMSVIDGQRLLNCKEAEDRVRSKNSVSRFNKKKS